MLPATQAALIESPLRWDPWQRPLEVYETTIKKTMALTMPFPVPFWACYMVFQNPKRNDKDSQVAQTSRPLYPKVAHKSMKAIIITGHRIPSVLEAPER